MNKFLVAGTDEKMQSCCDRLSAQGFEAKCFTSLNDDISAFDYIVLPLPALTEGKVSGTDFTPESLTKLLRQNQIVFFGNMSNIFPCRSFCYSKNEDFIVENSRLTAQGVLKIILDNVKTDIAFLKVAVTGFGHCGKEICRLLKNAGCDVTSFSRRAETREQAENEGFKTKTFNDSFSDFDIIVNTVPQNIFSAESVKFFKDNLIYIEIASAPYGLNPSEAENVKFRYIMAKGLPGRFTPVSGGVNIADTVVRILKEANYE